MEHFGKAIMASLIATLVLSALMVLKARLGVMPELNLPLMIADAIGKPDEAMIGWVVHIQVGIVGYSLALSLLDEVLAGDSHLLHGVLLALGGWLAMMLTVMPLAGAGFFGLGLGIRVPLVTLALHLVFGAILGGFYGRAIRRERRSRDLHA